MYLFVSIPGGPRHVDSCDPFLVKQLILYWQAGRGVRRDEERKLAIVFAQGDSGTFNRLTVSSEYAPQHAEIKEK